MKWPWVKAPENRGTLTLLPNGQSVLGFPNGYHLTEEATVEVHRSLAEYTLRGSLKSLVFPFPVDVVDRRNG